MPASSQSTTPAQLPPVLSGGALIAYWRAHPQQAPAPIRDALQRLTTVQATVENAPLLANPGAVGITSDVFILDSVGLPQNEESVTVCRNRPEVVLGATND